MCSEVASSSQQGFWHLQSFKKRTEALIQYFFLTKLNQLFSRTQMSYPLTDQFFESCQTFRANRVPSFWIMTTAVTDNGDICKIYFVAFKNSYFKLFLRVRQSVFLNDQKNAISFQLTSKNTNKNIFKWGRNARTGI